MADVLTNIKNEAERFLKRIDLSKISGEVSSILTGLTQPTTHTGSSGEWSATVVTDPQALTVAVTVNRHGQYAFNVGAAPMVLFGASATTAATIDALVGDLAKAIPDIALVASVVGQVAGALKVIEAVAAVAA